MGAVPPSPCTVEQLIAVLGDAAADTLIRLWGGRRLRIPPAGARERHARDRRIRARLDAGETYAAAAIAEGVSVRHVVTIAKRPS